MQSPPIGRALVLTAIITLPATVHGATATFRTLEWLTDANPASYARAISADGRYIVGSSYTGEVIARVAIMHTVMWNASGRVNDLGNIPGTYSHSYAMAISPDGAFIAGAQGTDNGATATLWTESTGAVPVGPPSDTWGSYATGVSNNGTVVGWSIADGAFRWTSQSGSTMLGSGRANGISADGRVVVGEGGTAYRWTESEGLISLGDLPGGATLSGATAVSADGSVIVGFGHDELGSQAVRWTQETGLVALGDLPGGNHRSVALAVSADGSTVVGTSNGSLGDEATIWDATHGLRSLREVLTTEYGLDLSGWTLSSATGISTDKRTIIGNGTYRGSLVRSWVVTLPEPATAGMTLLMGLSLLSRRHSKRGFGA